MVVLDGFGRGIFCTKEPSGNHPSVNKPPLGAILEPRLLELLASIASRALPSAVRLLAETTFGGTRFSGDWHGKQHSCSFSIYDTVDLLSLFLSHPPSPPLSLSLSRSLCSLVGWLDKQGGATSALQALCQGLGIICVQSNHTSGRVASCENPIVMSHATH